MSEGSETYYSKILLFGEYTLMMGSKALAIPFSRYSGRLKLFSKDIPEHLLSNRYLRDFYFYLVNNRDKFPAGFDFDLNEFKSDINKGLFFDSDIPQGYGVGSSGALVASVFNAYSGIRYMSLQEDQLPDLKRYFSFMESCFHGKSSGLDPLISYINKPILVSSSEKIEMVCFPNNEIKSDYEIFLLDTEITSSTELLVQKFMENLNDESYKNLIVSGLIPLNESCVDS